MKCPMRFATKDESKLCVKNACAWWTVRRDRNSGEVVAEGCAVAFAQTPAAVSSLIVATKND